MVENLATLSLDSIKYWATLSLILGKSRKKDKSHIMHHFFKFTPLSWNCFQSIHLFLSGHLSWIFLRFDDNGDFAGKTVFDQNISLPYFEEENEGEIEIDITRETSNPLEPVQLFPPMRPQAPRTSSATKGDVCETFPDDSTIISKLGKALLKVLGPSTQLSNFDKNKRLFDTVPNETKYKQRYQSGRNTMLTKLNALNKKVTEWLSKWEQQFFIDTVREPAVEDIKNDVLASVVYDKIQLIIGVGYSIAKNTNLALTYRSGFFWDPWHVSR